MNWEIEIRVEVLHQLDFFGQIRLDTFPHKQFEHKTDNGKGYSPAIDHNDNDSCYFQKIIRKLIHIIKSPVDRLFSESSDSEHDEGSNSNNRNSRKEYVH